jgi:hypothetical protein
MKKIDRRSALKLGFAAASGAVIRPVAAQTTDALAGKDTSPWPGVVVRTYGESPSLIPGFKTVFDAGHHHAARLEDHGSANA